MALNDKKPLAPPAAAPADWRHESGPLRNFLDDPSVSEIMVNRHDCIFIEKGGVVHALEGGFSSAEALNRFAQACAVSAGRELNRRHPCLDTRLPDGSRLSIIIPPVALDGPIITIRKHNKRNLNHVELTQLGAVDDKLLVFLYQLVVCRQNLIVSGGTSSGKTTLLNVLSSFIPGKERVVTIEDTAELNLPVRNLVRMESRPEIGQDPGVSTHELVLSALRMRPDRIIVGECRGSEAWDMLLAMNTGHEGSMTTLHANSAYDALRRLEAMVLRSGQEVPLNMIKTDIASTLNFVVHMERQADGVRRVTEVVEVVGRDGDNYDVREIFKWSAAGGFVSTGHVPEFVSNPTHPDLQLSPDFFSPKYKYAPSAA
ncbi:MAG TPA: ATPase, T2SS/T4P/T4SS family [Bdellovibrionales bacterium]|nr:ATPase, T2SS/T4P/T4SS family [Bdellovibrionales bacterium]